MWSTFLTTLQVVALISQQQVLAEGHSDAAVHTAHGEQEVGVTATGHLQKPKVMRKHEENESEEHQHHHHTHNAVHAKQMFKSLDLNGDGWVSGAEVKEGVKNTDFHMPKVLAEMLSHVNSGDKQSGFDYAQFHNAVETVAKNHALHHDGHHSAHHKAAVHEHKHSHHEALLEVGGQGEPDKSTWVTCGGHKAPSCSVCTKTDDSGAEVFDHGSEWCHGDCVYAEGACHKAGTVTVPAGEEAKGTGEHATTPTPDIQNPNMTGFDNTVVADAAQDAIKEEKLEKKEKEEKKEEKGGGVWVVIIIVFGGIVGICCIISIVFGVVLAFRTPDAKLMEDAGAEGEGEGEGEEGEGEAEEAAAES